MLLSTLYGGKNMSFWWQGKKLSRTLPPPLKEEKREFTQRGGGMEIRTNKQPCHALPNAEYGSSGPLYPEERRAAEALTDLITLLPPPSDQPTYKH